MTIINANSLEARVKTLEGELEAAQLEMSRMEIELRAFRRVADTIPVGVVLSDQAGEITYGNDALTQMVRHPIRHSKDVESYTEWVSYHADGRQVESHEYPLAKVLSEGAEHSELDVHYLRGDGSKFWMKIVGEPIFDDDNVLTGAIVATVDIDAEMRLQDEQRLMIAELNHRVKNAFTVSQAIVGRILRIAGGDPKLADTIDARLKAYATSHARMTGSEWKRVPLKTVALDVLEPIVGDQLELSGPKFFVPARMALSLSMAFYELATNAVKHGALSTADGKVLLEWNKRERDGEASWELSWTETGGPAPGTPNEPGFGTFITGRALMMETRGTVAVDYPESGLRWTLTMPPPHKQGT